MGQARVQKEGKKKLTLLDEIAATTRFDAATVDALADTTRNARSWHRIRHATLPHRAAD